MTDGNMISSGNLLLAGALAVGLAGGFLISMGPQTAGTSGEGWRSIQLQEVRTGEKFTVSELEKPVLVEAFAVWCPTCTRQQEEIKELHGEVNVTSVSLDIDPNEDRQEVLEHVRSNGFDWRYAIAPTELTRKLVSRYGNSMANPPSSPVVLVCENGTRKLQEGGNRLQNWRKR